MAPVGYEGILECYMENDDYSGINWEKREDIILSWLRAAYT